MGFMGFSGVVKGFVRNFQAFSSDIERFKEDLEGI